jgi:hypothetical protein
MAAASVSPENGLTNSCTFGPGVAPSASLWPVAKIAGNPDTRAFVRAANINPQQDHRHRHLLKVCARVTAAIAETEMDADVQTVFELQARCGRRYSAAFAR